MGGEVDLHIHSDRSSDGSVAPAKIVRLAIDLRLKAIAISDHDSVAAYPEALDAAEGSGVEVIPSIELTTIFRDREFHLLLPLLDWEAPGVGQLVREVADRRFQEAKARVERLQDLGLDITWEEVVEATAPFPPLGVTIALAVLDKHRSSPPDNLAKYYAAASESSAPYRFYKDFFGAGRPACVRRRNLPLTEVLGKVSQFGAVPVMAHPGAYFQKATREDIEALAALGLQGIEVFTTYHDTDQTEFYGRIAEELDLVATAGSDFHGDLKPHIPFGSLAQGGYEIVEALKARRP